MIIEIDRGGRKRLHTQSSFKARVMALEGREVSGLGKNGGLDLGKAYFRMANEEELRTVKRARDDGAWGRMERQRCRVCNGTLIDQAVKVLRLPCFACEGTGLEPVRNAM